MVAERNADNGGTGEAVGVGAPALGQELLRGLRHDLRTPINHIVGYSELLLEVADERGVADLAGDLGKIRRAGTDLLALVADWLDPARAPAGVPDAAALGRELRTPLNAIVGYSELLQEEAEAQGCADLAPDLERIRAAGARLLARVEALAELSRHAGAGTPQAGAPDAPPATPSPHADPPTMRDALTLPVGQGRLLVADDDPVNRDLLSRRLERLGYSVALAEDGRAALERLRAEPFDLLLLDVLMPELDGYGVLVHLRADDALRHIPVIVLSASDETESAVRCIELGAEDYLPKPTDAVVLRARIGASLEKKRLHDQEREHLATIERMAAELAEWNRTLERRVAEQVAELDRVARLKRFLPPQVAERIVASGDESVLQSHRRQVTSVFCDLRGFTSFSETAEPEEVMEVLGEYHAALGELIARHEGTVEHFAGDGLLVMFNDPLPCPDPQARAARMALAMRDRMAELSVAWRRRGHALGFGVGISHGYATLGQIGMEGRTHYAAIGSVVNLAARLCGEAKDGQILVSQRVATAVESEVEVRSVGQLALKGFHARIPAFEIMGLRADTR